MVGSAGLGVFCCSIASSNPSMDGNEGKECIKIRDKWRRGRAGSIRRERAAKGR